MKKTVFVFLLAIYACITYASHITGGEMTYKYLGPGLQPHTKLYGITLKLFRDQNTIGAPMPTLVYIGIFNNDDNKQYPAADQPREVKIREEEQVGVDPFPPCVKNATELDYHVGYFYFEISLPDNIKGYTAAYQTCCRVNPLNNVLSDAGTGGTGSSYTCVIPPIADESPTFLANVDLICQNRFFKLNFRAVDEDDDSLVYSFAEAYNGGQAINANNINPAPPPYIPVTYLGNFSGIAPLGNQVRIDPLTGIISGIAPVSGKYVVSVRVTSYKKGVYVGEHRKDFIINVGDCDVPGAALEPKPVTCSGYSVRFSNDNPSVLNKTFSWDFGDPKSGTLNTSNLTTPTHIYSDTGMFVYKLVVNRGEPCSDSTTQTVKIYPGFTPGFSSAGQCKNTPIQFTDTTKSRYGQVNSWSWDFGDPQSPDDTSHQKNPAHIFTAPASYNVHLIVTDSKGCIDTATIAVKINDRPDFTVSRDTLICSVDTLQLNATGTGTFFWRPGYNISNQQTPAPLVSPAIPTKYYVSFSDAYGCKGNDSVFVDVRNFVSLTLGNDTSICRSDSLVLTPRSDALQYRWTPSGSLNDDALKNPVATPLSTTVYTLVASIGKCQTTDEILVKVAPYPAANAGRDSSICAGNSVQLSASGGTFYKWSPAFFLSDPDIANPVASPVHDINYIVSVSDTLGCPKPVKDSVKITVVNITAEAGLTDTSVVVNQPLQLNASGGEFYIWTPSVDLSNSTISNPVALLNNSRQYVVRVSRAGCFDTDTITVTVYKVGPGIYVPNAFTPNNDGMNDILRPIPLGMRTISYFRVYNRWGKLLFSSAQTGRGWDGTFNGSPQEPAVYVWMVEGIDYLGRKISRKGSAVLTR